MKNKLKLASLALGMLFLCGATAGSAEDPLVTKSWVDSYVSAEMKVLENRVAVLSDRLNDSTVVRFWIDVKTVSIDGTKTAIDTAPVIIDSKTYVPLRVLSDAIGATCLWDDATKKITYAADNMVLEMWIDSTTICVNGLEVAVEAAPLIVDGRTIVPLRIVSENLGMTATWDNDTKSVTIEG